MTDTTGVDQGLRKLEVELQKARANGERLGRSLHAAMSKDLAAALHRAEVAEAAARKADKSAKSARKRADRAEKKLKTLQGSTTWKAGRALTAAPRAAKRALRRPSA